MKTLKVDHNEMILLKEIVQKYSKEVENEHYRLINTSITEEQRKQYSQDKEIIDSLKIKLDKK